jgi:hypothetical protein
MPPSLPKFLKFPLAEFEMSMGFCLLKKRAIRS